VPAYVIRVRYCACNLGQINSVVSSHSRFCLFLSEQNENVFAGRMRTSLVLARGNLLTCRSPETPYWAFWADVVIFQMLSDAFSESLNQTTLLEHISRFYF